MDSEIRAGLTAFLATDEGKALLREALTTMTLREGRTFIEKTTTNLAGWKMARESFVMVSSELQDYLDRFHQTRSLTAFAWNRATEESRREASRYHFTDERWEQMATKLTTTIRSTSWFGKRFGLDLESPDDLTQNEDWDIITSTLAALSRIVDEIDRDLKAYVPSLLCLCEQMSTPEMSKHLDNMDVLLLPWDMRSMRSDFLEKQDSASRDRYADILPGAIQRLPEEHSRAYRIIRPGIVHYNERLEVKPKVRQLG